MGTISFYDDINGKGNLVQIVNDNPGQYFKPEKNDAIKSAVLNNVRSGCRIDVFDSPDASTEDDYTIINVNEVLAQYTIDSFEKTDINKTSPVTEVYHKVNGLNGKISRIMIA